MSNENLVMIISYNDYYKQLLDSQLIKHGYKTIIFMNLQQIPDNLYMTIPELVIIVAEDKAAPICSAARSLPDIASVPIIIISSSNDISDRAESFRAGCSDYVTSPFDETEIIARIGIHLENRRLHQWLRDKITEHTKEFTQAQMETIVAMAELAESRDPLTTCHIDRIRRYCSVLAKKLSLDDQFRREINDEFVDLIYHASALHDLGKIGVRDVILNKYGKLTKEEFEIIISHTTKGSIALGSVVENHPNNSLIRMSVEIIRFHHEGWNGKGYPIGIAGEEIPLAARIMTVADVYDAGRSKRAYKEAKTHEQTAEELLKMRGVHLDPRIVDAFIAVQYELVNIYRQFSRG